MTEIDPHRSLPRNLWQRFLGISATRPAADPGSFHHEDGRITVDLDRVPELAEPGSAIRIESPDLPDRYLVLHGDDGVFHAFQNRCMHMGRRLDPVPGAGTVQCCSVSKTTYDYAGNVVRGPARKGLEVCTVLVEGRTLIIKV